MDRAKLMFRNPKTGEMKSPEDLVHDVLAKAPHALDDLRAAEVATSEEQVLILQLNGGSAQITSAPVTTLAGTIGLRPNRPSTARHVVLYFMGAAYPTWVDLPVLGKVPLPSFDTGTGQPRDVDEIVRELVHQVPGAAADLVEAELARGGEQALLVSFQEGGMGVVPLASLSTHPGLKSLLKPGKPPTARYVVLTSTSGAQCTWIELGGPQTN